MLTPRLTNCVECASITSLIEDIDCKLAKLGSKLYNNITLMLNNTFSVDDMITLLHYKRILQYKYVNEDYLEDYTVDMIADRVKTLKYRK